MNQMSGPSNVGMQGPQSKRCPLCGATVIPDPLGLYECACGWGGPGDPLEHDRGLAKLFARTDRDLANGQAHRDLSRLATRGDSASSLNPLYTAALLGGAILVIIVLGTIGGLSGWVLVSSIADHAWVAAIIGGIILAMIVVAMVSMFRGVPRYSGVPVTQDRFPALMATLDEVCQRVGAPLPKRVSIVPDGDFGVLRGIDGTHLHIGAAAMPILSDVEFKSILAQGISHAHHQYSTIYRVCLNCERLMHELVYGILEGAQGQSVSALRSSRMFPRARRYTTGNYSAGMGLFGLVFTWTIMLPFRLLWSGYHLLRMHQSRSAEFAADRTAVLAYGPQAFINGLTGLLVARRTFVKSSDTLRGEMLRHNSQNFFAEMRRHYDALPPNVIAQLRVEATTGFRTLARSHPTTGDRLRAAYQLSATTAPSPAPVQPAYMLLAPAGAPNADAVEIELTKLLFASKKK